MTGQLPPERSRTAKQSGGVSQLPIQVSWGAPLEPDDPDYLDPLSARRHSDAPVPSHLLDVKPRVQCWANSRGELEPPPARTYYKPSHADCLAVKEKQMSLRAYRIQQREESIREYRAKHSAMGHVVPTYTIP